MAKDKKELSFEQAITRLEEIVQVLDGGERPLSESLLLFEEGVKLARECSAQLSDAKGRLEQCIKADNGAVETAALEV